jgi:hypothetical protein
MGAAAARLEAVGRRGALLVVPHMHGQADARSLGSCLSLDLRGNSLVCERERPASGEPSNVAESGLHAGFAARRAEPTGSTWRTRLL